MNDDSIGTNLQEKPDCILGFIQTVNIKYEDLISTVSEDSNSRKLVQELFLAGDIMSRVARKSVFGFSDQG